MSFDVHDAKKVLDIAGRGLKALEAVGQLAKGALGAKGFPDDKLEKAESVLGAIVGIVDAVRGGLDGTVAIEQIDAEIKKFTTSLSDNDAAARGEVDAKFGE